MVTVPGYRIGELIYDGYRTQVYRCQRISDSQAAIVKLLKTEYPSFRELVGFRNQYTITKNLDIPGIVKPYSLEPYQNGFALIMEDLGAVSLQEYRNAGEPLPLEEFFPIAIAMAEILEGLYRHRVIHKDIKPQNIIINRETKEIRLIDFSIASLLPRETQEIQSPNVLEGTIAYISPEQTGRMNRAIDYRTDFYGLGVTFYELLTGQLPFSSGDPMELVHCHIAIQPTAPIEINPAIPQMVNDITIKLMAKTAESRYQSARGLGRDLETCWQQWQSQGRIDPFALAARDISDRFVIPEKLYGRETEVATLLAAFERIAGKADDLSAVNSPAQLTTNNQQLTTDNQQLTTNKVEMMLVAGFSGIGKTAVVNEVHKPIVRQRGYFIKGKFDQFKRNIPFSAFVQALGNLMGQLLTETASELEKWQAQILEALGENARVIIDVIPELEKIIGQQPEVPELAGNAAQNRFNLLFSKFIQVFARPEHPLVIFLDDLQWADGGSLKLMQLLMSETDESNVSSLLLIGAYRDNEVSPAHPLILTLEEIRKTEAIVNLITLAPLDLPSLNHLIADTLSCPPELARPLTELVHQKTKGNPFFSNQFLKSLHAEGLISFSESSGYWQCDMAGVKLLSLSDDVVEFMALQLQKLPANTRDVLKLAACIGNQFDLAALSIVYEKSPAETAADLWKALQSGMIIPESEVYKFFTETASDSSDPLTIPQSEIPYKFLHDRVQQAAYFLIPADRKQSTHLKIGQLLLQNTPVTAREEQIFDIVNQLNYGRELIVQPEKRTELAELNLLAGQKAKAATAYAAAVGYLNTGMELLATNSWESQYELTLSLYEESAEALYLNTEYDRAAQLAAVVLQAAKTLLDKKKIYEIQIQFLGAQNQLQEAIDTSLQVVEMLGVTLAKAPPLQMQDMSVSELYDLPPMTDPYKLAALRLLILIFAPTFIAQPSLLPALSFTMVELCLNYGNSPLAPYAYTFYGFLQCCIFGKISTGYNMGKLGLQMFDKFDSKEIKCKVYNMFNSFVRHWREPARASLEPLRETMQIGLETGDIEFTAYAALPSCSNILFVGENLETVEKYQRQYIGLIEKIRQEFQLYYAQIWGQLTLNLRGEAADKFTLRGELFDETKMLPIFLETKNFSSLFCVYLAKTILSYLFKDYTAASSWASEAQKYAGAMVGLLALAEHNFYHSLSLLALSRTRSQLSREEENLKQVAVNQKQMNIWTEHAPANFQHKYDLVEAEKARLLGRVVAAIDGYERAIKGAREAKYYHQEALVYELAAEFYLDRGMTEIAQTYLINAYYSYARWGAKAKVEDFEVIYSELLTPILNRKISPTGTETAIQISAGTVTSSSDKNVSEALDLATVLKASQALSQAIRLEQLLLRLMQEAIANAGAQKCALILQEQDKLAIEASGFAGGASIETFCVTSMLQSIPLESSQEIPVSVINYVWRTRETLVIADAQAETTFAHDSYIIERQPKSILCSPIVNQGQLTGMMYLENNLTTGAFTPSRLQVLEILSGQAAISIENAQFYSKLEQKVAERTQQLAQANQEITALNEKLKSENLRMAAELEVTRKLQKYLLPREAELARIPGLEIAGFMEPAEEVGGDYYDVLQLEDLLKIAIGDVTGHGLESGVVTIMAQTAVRTLLEAKETDPVKFLDVLNRTIYKNVERMNSDKNMTLALLDYSQGVLSLSGQHEEMILVRSPGTIELIDTIDLGFPIGLDSDIADFIGQTQIELQPGDGVVLYTDGITEAENLAGVQYGLERLCEIVSQNWSQDADRIRQAAIADLRQHIGEQKVFDDITLVVLKQK